MAAELEQWIENAIRGMENALRANPQDVREQYAKQLKDLQEAYGEAMLELRVRNSTPSLQGLLWRVRLVGLSKCIRPVTGALSSWPRWIAAHVWPNKLSRLRRPFFSDRLGALG